MNKGKYPLSPKEVAQKLKISQNELTKRLDVGTSTLYFWSKEGIPYEYVNRRTGKKVKIGKVIDELLNGKNVNPSPKLQTISTKRPIKRKSKVQNVEIESLEVNKKESSKPIIVVMSEDESKIKNVLKDFYSRS
jgi:hypothetical protein